MTGGDNKEKKSEAHGAMVPWCHGANNLSSWPSGYTAPLLSVEDGSNPGGDRDAPSNPNPLFLGAGERERDTELERERVEHGEKGTERHNSRG